MRARDLHGGGGDAGGSKTAENSGDEQLRRRWLLRQNSAQRRQGRQRNFRVLGEEHDAILLTWGGAFK